MGDSRDDAVDVVIVGGGHNGLTAAAYLARAGRRVLLLEAADVLGGAAVSAQAFEGVDARLSRYSYLVSLLPGQIVDDLGLDLELVRRRYSSYTPDPRDPTRGLLVDNEADDAERRAAFARVDAEGDLAAWDRWYAATTRLAEVVFPTLTRPLPTRAAMRAAVQESLGEDGDRVWRDLVDRPVGEAVEREFGSDLVRGVVVTDALIGTYADPARDLEANRCYLYHVIGGGTGDWDVPVGGMGAVSGALVRAASGAGARLQTGSRVVALTPDGDVTYERGGRTHEVRAGVVLSGVAPAVLESLLGAGLGVAADPPRVEGAQVKVNLLLTRLPALRDHEVDPRAAFAGTFHINELGMQLDAAFRQAGTGQVPEPLPCEIYCHTLSDRSILGDGLGPDAQTLTVFGLHVPDRLVDALGNDALRAQLEDAVIASLDSVLAEPLRDVLARDVHGRPCLEVRTTRDIQESIGMPGGNIFHGPLSWPWRVDDDGAGVEGRVEGGREDGGGSPRLTPAQRWGVATRHPRILLCGSGAVRGGAVSGIGGHNAAMAVLEAE